MFDILKNSVKRWLDMDVDVYHIVLTTSDEAKEKDLCHDFDLFIESISKYCIVEYFAVLTDEGNGTIHLLVNYNIPLSLIRDRWSVIHSNSFKVSSDKVCFDYKADIYFIDTLSVYLATQESIDGVLFSKNWFKDGIDLSRTFDGINVRLF